MVFKIRTDHKKHETCQYLQLPEYHTLIKTRMGEHNFSKTIKYRATRIT